MDSSPTEQVSKDDPLKQISQNKRSQVKMRQNKKYKEMVLQPIESVLEEDDSLLQLPKSVNNKEIAIKKVSIVQPTISDQSMNQQDYDETLLCSTLEVRSTLNKREETDSKIQERNWFMFDKNQRETYRTFI